MTLDLNIRIAGQAGQGMQAVSQALGKLFVRHGHHVRIHHAVESRIRGGHNFAQVRVRCEPFWGIRERVDILIALDPGAVDHDLGALAEDGIVILDAGSASPPSPLPPNHLSLPLEKLAAEAGGGTIMANTVATGATLALVGWEIEPLLDYLEERFGQKGTETVAQNRACAVSGFRYARQHFEPRPGHRVPPGRRDGARLLLTGSEAMAIGALCSGLKFYAGYPMSPSTSIMEYVASKAREFNIVVEPAEDEIAALNMAIGASFAGVRAMTATSGGGFCLMVEAFGLAGMTETPVVVVIGQRPGPATGLATRTEQGDLGFVIHAGHGDFPRAVLAPGHPEQAFYALCRAFNLADRYQTPVVVLGDQDLLDSSFTVPELDAGRVGIDRGRIAGDEEIGPDGSYRRYAWDPTGISPRLFPGHSKAVVYACSDEHTEEGHITEDRRVRKMMVDKRMKKLEGIRRELIGPESYPEDGEGDIVLLGWGSTYGPIREAVDLLRAEGIRARMLHFCDVYPLPVDAPDRWIGKGAAVIGVEGNATGEFADLFRLETGVSVQHKILKVDGRPFSAEEIAGRVRDTV